MRPSLIISRQLKKPGENSRPIVTRPMDHKPIGRFYVLQMIHLLKSGGQVILPDFRSTSGTRLVELSMQGGETSGIRYTVSGSGNGIEPHCGLRQ